MKKTTWALAATICLFGAAAISCNGNCNKASNPGSANFDDDATYTGVLPAADCLGIRYTLSLDYDDDSNSTNGDYKLVETYVQNDSTAPLGVKDALSEKSKGDFSVSTKDNMKCLTLVPKRGSTDTLYFVQNTDSTLTMTNANFEMPVTPGYTLKIVK